MRRAVSLSRFQLALVVAASLVGLSLALGGVARGIAYAAEGLQSADAASSPAFEEGEILVVYETPPSQQGMSSLSAMNAFEGFSVVEVEEAMPIVDDGRTVHLTLADDGDVDALIERLNAQPNVAFAQRVFRYGLLEDADELAEMQRAMDAVPEASSAANDPKLSEQYYLNAWGDEGGTGANVFAAWDLVATNGNASEPVTVAVLDTGVRATHEDLADNLDTVHMKDVFSNTAAGVITDYVGHGTHVAGIVAASADNGLGIAGAAGFDARVLPIKVFNNESGEYSSTNSVYLLRAYNYLAGLIESGAVTNLHVVNMSLGGYGRLDADDEALRQAIERFRSDFDVLTVCAGGNGDEYGNPYVQSSYPADYEECFAVTALDAKGQNVYWSDYNQYKDISAPGYGIYSTYNASDSSYTAMSGTSMASPLVAGCAALLWAVEPELTVNEVVEAIQETAHELDPNGENYRSPVQTGSAGAIDAAAAVGYVLENFSTDLAAKSMRLAEVSIVDFVFYDGEAHTPSVTVTYDGVALREGTDYTLEYSDNVNAGKGKVKVTGIGEYRGSKTVRFGICYDLSDAQRATVMAIGDRQYTGAPQTVLPRVYYDGIALAKGIDFSISYRDNVRGQTAVAVLEGMGIFRGSLEAPFTIANGPETLLEPLEQAESLLQSTYASADGMDVSPDEQWAGADAREALRAAYEDAQAVYDAAAPSAAQVIEARESLVAACEAYEGELAPGTKAEPSDEPAEGEAGDQAESGDGPDDPAEPDQPSEMEDFSAPEVIRFMDVAYGVDWVDTEGWLDEVQRLGLMSGYKNADGSWAYLFGPEDAVTRGQLAVILFRYAEPSSKATTDAAAYEGNATAFTDNPDGLYYTAAINWAAKRGIMTGDASTGYTTVRPEDPVTRQEVACMLYRFGNANGVDVATASADAYAGAPDAAEVAAWAAREMGWCYVNGIITGAKTDGRLMPGEQATRAQMAKMSVMAIRSLP